jgi:hypothetical protein
MFRLSVIFLLFVFSFALTPKEYQQKLGIGINVNWATFKKEIRCYSYKDVTAFKKAGFTTIRIRFKDRVNDEKYLKHLKKIVNDVLKAHMIPVLAYGAKKFRNDPKKYMNNALKVWKIVADEFKNYPDVLSFDLIIEPGRKLNKNVDILNEFYEKAVREIRKTNPKRIIFLAPIHCSNPYFLNKIKFPKDKFIMAEWHFYAAGPSKTRPKKLWTTGTAHEKKLILDKIRYAYNWQEKHHIYTWVGAWMPSDYNHGNDYTIKEQVKFAHFMSCALRKYHIPFAINADGQFFDCKSKKWRKKRLPVLRAIFQPCE